MILSKITPPQKKETQDETYPILKINPKANLLVLFLTSKKGVILGGALDMYRRFGEYRENLDAHTFKIFTGSVEISNKK